MTRQKRASEKIIVALDVETADAAISLVSQLKNEVGVFKVGLELLNAEGPGIFARLRDAGAERFFYDAKLHDIPNTVAGAMRSIAKSGAWCVTVHATGGRAMLEAAVKTAREGTTSFPHPLVLAVTVLTSISQEVLQTELRVAETVQSQAVYLAELARSAGCDGVIASPLEIVALRTAIPDPDFLIVTPGVRPSGSALGDQARVMTPSAAIQAGASYLVIGRPITQASDPAAAARAIAEEIATGMTGTKIERTLHAVA